MRWVVTIEKLRRHMRSKVFRGYILCEKCVECYVPCAALLLQNDCGRLHILPMVYLKVERHGEEASICRSYAGQFCSGRRPLLFIGKFPHPWGGVLVAVHEAFDSPEFGKILLSHYPELEGRLLTEELLRRVGCDLEAEIAMWELSR